MDTQTTTTTTTTKTLLELIEEQANFERRLKSLSNCLPSWKSDRDRLIENSCHSLGLSDMVANFDGDPGLLAMIEREIAQCQERRRQVALAVRRADLHVRIAVGEQSLYRAEAVELAAQWRQRQGSLKSELEQAARQLVNAAAPGNAIVMGASQRPFADVLADLVELGDRQRELAGRLAASAAATPVDPDTGAVVDAAEQAPADSDAVTLHDLVIQRQKLRELGALLQKTVDTDFRNHLRGGHGKELVLETPAFDRAELQWRIDRLAEEERQLNLRIQRANFDCTWELNGRPCSVAELLDRRAEIDRRARANERLLATSCLESGHAGGKRAAKRRVKADDLMPSLKQAWDDLLELNVAIRRASTARRPPVGFDLPAPERT